jgi:hypothetical protein
MPSTDMAMTSFDNLRDMPPVLTSKEAARVFV